MKDSPYKLVRIILGEDESSELWDQLLAVGDAMDKEQSGDTSDLTAYLDLIADIQNGGIQQCIEHGRDWGEFYDAVRFLRRFGGEAAKNVASRLLSLEDSYVLGKEDYDESDEKRRSGEGYDANHDPFDDYLNDFGIVEDVIYDKETMNAVHRELLAKLKSPATLTSSPAADPATPSPSA